MKKLMMLGLLLSGFSSAKDLVPVKLQLKWFPQAQFAGFFVAQAKGFYEAEGLDVQLISSGDNPPINTVVSGTVDFGTTWITDLLTARQQGLPVVHIAQIFQKSGFTLVSLKSNNINRPQDFRANVWGCGQVATNTPQWPC